jgi:hypothetical protein
MAQSITVRIHRSVSVDVRTPYELGTELVALIKAGTAKHRLPLVTTATVLIPTSLHKQDDVAHAAQEFSAFGGSLEYVRDLSERPHVSQVRLTSSTPKSVSQLRPSSPREAAHVTAAA